MAEDMDEFKFFLVFRTYFYCVYEITCKGTVEKAQWKKMLSGKPDVLSSIHETHIVGEN